MTVGDVESFFEEQVSAWPLAARNYADLAQCEIKRVGEMTVMFNPARAASSKAKTDAGSIASRPCFLCAGNRPAEQRALSWRGYEILVNPFPIFDRHFTIAATSHAPQNISGRIGDMIALARVLDGYTVFFNGARCGASAPDHLHFQAAPFEPHISVECHKIEVIDDAEAVGHAERYLESIGQPHGEMVNILCYRDCDAGQLVIDIVRRKCHRPSFYGTGEGEMLLSPASVEMAGYLVTPRREDYVAVTPEIIDCMAREVAFSRDKSRGMDKHG